MVKAKIDDVIDHNILYLQPLNDTITSCIPATATSQPLLKAQRAVRALEYHSSIQESEANAIDVESGEKRKVERRGAAKFPGQCRKTM
jgi:hypothetical protein